MSLLVKLVAQQKIADSGHEISSMLRHSALRRCGDRQSLVYTYFNSGDIRLSQLGSHDSKETILISLPIFKPLAIHMHHVDFKLPKKP